MMTNLVTELREWTGQESICTCQDLARRAANEIERLRGLLKRAADTVEGCCNCLNQVPIGKEIEAELGSSGEPT